MTQTCPCHSGRPYAQCCQPYHNGTKPETAVALMRSRYAAYALNKISYIIQTEHPQSPRQQTDKATWRKELKWFCQHTHFIGLQILDEATLGQNEATVTFHAILMQTGQDASFTECSIFERVNGRWLYLKPTQGKNWGR